MGEGLGELIGPIVIDAEKKLRAPQGGTKLNCFFKCRDGSGELVLKVPDKAQPLESLRILAQLQANFVLPFRRGEIARCFGLLGGFEMALYTRSLARQNNRREEQDSY